MRSLGIISLLLPGAAVMAQSSCADALPIGIGLHSVITLDTGDPPPFPCMTGPSTPQHGAWFAYTAAVDTGIRISTNVPGGPVGFNTRVHVYSGGCGDLICLAADASTGPNSTTLAEFPVVAGATYHIVWDNLFGENTFQFSLDAFDRAPDTTSFVLLQPPFTEGAMGVVDMDRDGRDDLIVPGLNSVRIAYQTDAGFQTSSYLTDPADHQATWSFAVGDYDGNGRRDLLYGGGSGATFMRANATGTGFAENSFQQYIFSQRTNFVDLNNDGHLDAFVCHDIDANVAFLNDGSGNLIFQQGGYGETCGNYGSIFTDIDNDGDQDLFVAKCGCDPADLLMTSNGNGAFEDVAPVQGLNDGHQSWSSAWGDFDNDGDMDVLIGTSAGPGHKLMANDGTGTFTNVTAGSGMDTWPSGTIEWTAHDFNNDGWIDILGGNALHLNRGGMTFEQMTNVPMNGAIGDLNNDGFLDITSYNTTHRNVGNGYNYIRFDLRGVESNRDGIGARVTITSALGQQIRDVRSGDGFRYMSFIGAHFGLGTDDAVEQVHIRWPSGHEDIITDPDINTTHIIEEGISTEVASTNGTEATLLPNPATDHITINGVAPNSQVTVLDAAGRIVQETALVNGQLDITSLSPGLHQLRVERATGPVWSRFAKE